MKRLILAPHGDDEVLGCGGVIAKHPDECAVAVMTSKIDGPNRDPREAEFYAAQKILEYGITYWDPLSIRSGQIQARMRDVVSGLDGLIAEQRPDVLYVPFPSLHQDHMGLYEAGLRASRLGYNGKRHYPRTVLAYDVAGYPVNLYQTALAWNYYETLTHDQVLRKMAAFDAYASQSVGGVCADDLERDAVTLGHTHGVDYAERFAVVRQVV